MADENKHFWSSIPGILTGIAAVLSAATGLYVAMRGDDNANRDTPAKVSLPAASSEPHAPAASTSEAVLPGDVFTLSAVIDDPDGYTNVRSMQSASSQIVARVEQGERFHTYLQQGNWWQVRTSDGKIGYMHVSRIRLTPEG